MRRFKVMRHSAGIIGCNYGVTDIYRIVDTHRGLAISRHTNYHEAREACSRLNSALEVLRAAANGGAA